MKLRLQDLIVSEEVADAYEMGKVIGHRHGAIHAQQPTAPRPPRELLDRLWGLADTLFAVDNRLGRRLYSLAQEFESADSPSETSTEPCLVEGCELLRDSKSGVARDD